MGTHSTLNVEQPHSEKTKAREHAVQFLYQCELDKIHYFSVGDFEQFVENFDVRSEIRDNMLLLVEGVFRQRSDIDEQIKGHSQNWRFERITKTDLCVLRVAIYEILAKASPRKVAINEGIELAKRFGSEDSGRFVNGILDKIQAP